MSHNQRVGRWGEEQATRYLQENGLEILARNERTPYGEIDIVARQADVVVFVEVKARTSHKMGLPETAVTPRKQAHMRASAEHYAAAHQIDHWQIDVIAVERFPDTPPKITRFENAL